MFIAIAGSADLYSTPALLMAAATVNIPAIVMNVGPMLNGKVTFVTLLTSGYAGRRLLGSGTLLWDARAAQAEGKINQEQLIRLVATSAPRYATTVSKC